MTNSNDTVRLIIAVQDELERIDYATRQLYQEMNELAVGPVEFFVDGGEIQGGAKSIDPATLNALILSITPITVAKVLEFLYSWTTRKDARSIKIKIQKQKGDTIEVEIPASTSQEELKRLINSVEESLSKIKRKGD